jgi:hypothetical protein
MFMPEQASALVYWLLRKPLLSFLQAKQTRGGSMASKDLLGLCGRVGLIMAAFAFVAAIIAGPLLEKAWFATLTITEHRGGQAPLPAKPSGHLQAEKQS